MSFRTKARRESFWNGEVILALFLGGCFNFAFAVASAKAQPANAVEMVLSSYAFAGALGGLTLAIIHFIGQAFASPTVAPYAVRKAASEGVAAIIVGAIVSHFSTRYVAVWVPKTDAADLMWLAYAIGVFAWRAMPIIIDQMPRLVAAVTDRILSGIKGVFGGGSA